MTWLLAGFLLCVAVFLRIVLALQPGLWVDEIFSLAMATGHSLEHPAADAIPELGDYVEHEEARPSWFFLRYMQHETPPAGAKRVIRAVLLSDTSPPLYYLLLNVWTRLAGTGDASLRLFSTVWALACFPLLWALGRQVGGTRTALTACALFAFSPPALYYAGEGRMYSLLWFLGLSLAWLSLALARRGSSPRILLLWILVASAGLLTHYFFAFVLMACVIWLWLHPGEFRRAHLAGLVALVGVLALPWYLQVPDSLSRWRVTAGWLNVPLTWQQLFTNPFTLAWSLFYDRPAWGSRVWVERFAALLYASLIVLILHRGTWRLFSRRRRLLWIWLLAACLGPVVFDVLMRTNTSTVWRYALPGLPAAMLLAALGMSRLSRRIHAAFLLLILLAWLPVIVDMFTGPSRPWEPFPEIAARLKAWAHSDDLIIVHSIPGGVLGVARYLGTDAPLASWVVQLGQRRMPNTIHAILKDRCRVALVKVHDMGEPSPAEGWLDTHATLERRDRLNASTKILYFHPKSPAGRSLSPCPVWSKSAPIAPGTLEPAVRRTVAWCPRTLNCQ